MIILSSAFNDFEYSTMDFIDDIRKELQKYGELLSKVLPNRVNKYKDYWLSTLCGFSKKYVNTLKNQLKSDSHKKLSNKSLNNIKQNIIEKLGKKAKVCLEIIKSYEENKINTHMFLENLSKELGRISG